MKKFMRCLLLGLGLLLPFLPTIPIIAAQTNASPRLTIEMRDGSRLICTSSQSEIRFRSALLGKFALPIEAIRSINCISNATAEITITNGDMLSAEFRDSEIEVKSGFGKLSLAVDKISRISISPVASQISGLVGLWSGEGNGNDSVNGNNAILTDITFGPGKVGQAFYFDGRDSEIKVPANPVLDVGAGDGFTVMAWIKPDDVTGLHPLFEWLEQDRLISSKFEVSAWINMRPGDRGVIMCGTTDTSGNRFLVANPDTLITGVFQHVVLTFDARSRIGIWYVNGIVVARRELSGVAADTKGNFWVGHHDARADNWSANTSFEGAMDEIAVYNRALSAEEVQSIFNSQGGADCAYHPQTSDGWHENWMR